MSMRTVSFRTPSEKLSALDAFAAGERRDRTYVLNEAIDNYLALQAQRDQMILEALEDVDAGRVVPHEEVLAWAQSLGTANPLPLPEAKTR